MITLRNHALRPYMTGLPMTFVLDNLQLDDIPGANFENSLYNFSQSEKR